MENSYHYQTMAKAIAYLRDNYDQQPSLDEVAGFVHMSKYHFQRTFKKWAGISPKEFLQYTTIEQAKKALLQGQSTLEAAHGVGLSGNSRLHDLFIKIESCSPGEFQKKSKGLTLYTGEFDTPFGKAALIESEKGIANLTFGTSNELMGLEQYRNARFKSGLGENGQRVKQYFSNWEVPTAPIQINLSGTPFQIQVWKALLQVPPSNLVAYQDIAKAIEKPKAVRAVGTAIGKNPIAYLIPCHRVIKGNGEYGNYHWDARRKLIINAYESAILHQDKP